MLPIQFFYRAAQSFPDHPALITPAETVTFIALMARVDAMAAALISLDTHECSRVAICAKNSIDHIVALLATLAAGKTWVPLNVRNGDAELQRAIEFTEPSVILTDEESAARFAFDAATSLVFGEKSELQRLIERFEGAAAPLVQGGLEETQAIKFTGGTTGVPKGVMQPRRAWNTNIVTQISCYGLRPDDRYLIVAPVTHGTSTYLLPVLGSGGAMVFPEDTSPAGILDAVERYDVTMMFMPPTLIYSVMAEQVARPRDTSSLRHLIYGAAPMRPNRIVEAREIFGDVLATTYGQTEAPQIATFLGPQDFRDEANVTSVGRETLLSEIAILDVDGNPLPLGTEGEVCIRGDLMMTGYWRQPEMTAKTIKNGWLYTGDIGVLDDRKFLFLKGRSRETIITGGFNVYPSDVENVLGRHPAVDDCAVVGIEDAKWGEAVHAAVVVRAGISTAEDELIAFVKQELDSVKAPKRIHFFDDLPRTPVGKVAKTEIAVTISAQRTQ